MQLEGGKSGVLCGILDFSVEFFFNFFFLGKKVKKKKKIIEDF